MTTHPLKPLSLLEKPTPSSNMGKIPTFAMLPFSKIVIDDRYQRTIGKQGRNNIVRILEGFDFAKFIPVVVTPIEDGLYAVIDGQHRSTAALMHPEIEEIPCYIVDVSPEQAAAVFAAINGQVTAILPGQIWKARIVAGDRFAIDVDKALRAADVKVIAYRTPGVGYRKGETLAVRTLESCYRKYGANVLITGLQAITQTGGGNPGCVVAPMIIAMCDIVQSIAEFQRAPTMLFDLMDELNLASILAETSAKARKEKRAHTLVLKELIAGYLMQAMRPQAAQ